MPKIHLSPAAKRKALLARVADAITEHAWDDVARRLTGLSGAMSAAEARGYVRVRAAAIVHREVQQAVDRDRRLRPSDQERLTDAVTDRIAAAAWSIRQAEADPRAA